jgi:hypothetical protein
MSRSSRTSASSGVAQTTGVTLAAMRTISAIRARPSAAVKYERTRVRMLTEVPT